MIVYNLPSHHKATDLNYQDGKYIYKIEPQGFGGIKIWYDLNNKMFRQLIRNVRIFQLFIHNGTVVQLNRFFAFLHF